MNNLIADSESFWRISVFVVVFTVLAGLELVFPRRRLTLPKGSRWLTNLGMSVLNTLLVRLLLPLAGIGAALLAQERGWGLLNNIELPAWLSILIFLLLFDLVIYLQHRLFHRVPMFWRLHRVHHTDADYDVTTGNRFHPGSILLSSLIKIGLTLMLGPLPMAVVMAEVLLNATAMFNHSNLSLPQRLDRVLRYIVVTPDMHRVHHSVDSIEHNRNFGFNFPWWDRLFGTYLDQPALGHTDMPIGIAGLSDREANSFSALLLQPLRED
jgi:sterol desaturase/sphingolipid hydroxylase (fatty acid hydroxylase superfamily)